MVSNMFGVAPCLTSRGIMNCHNRKKLAKQSARRSMLRLGTAMVILLAFNLMLAEALPEEEMPQHTDELHEIRESPAISPKTADAVQPMEDEPKQGVSDELHDLQSFLTSPNPPNPPNLSLTHEIDDNE